MLISSVLYLNADWQADRRGELVIYNEADTEEVARVMPEIGKLVIIMSEQLPHEVLPMLHPRASVTGWFHCNNTTATTIDPPPQLIY